MARSPRAGLRAGGRGDTTFGVEEGGGGRNSGCAPQKEEERAEADPRAGRATRVQPAAPAPTVGGRGGGSGAPRTEREEAEEEREAGRAGPAQELGGATHLCSRPAEPEWPGSLAAPTRRSGHAPTHPPSSRLLLQLQLRRHRRAQPGNHDGRAVRALTHLPPFPRLSPSARLPQTTVAALGGKALNALWPLPKRRAPARAWLGRRAPRVRRGVSGEGEQRLELEARSGEVR